MIYKESYRCIPYSRLKCHITLLGLMFALSFMVVIIGTWISAEIQGFTYFSAGEPNTIIRIFEWIGGFIAILIVSIKLKNNIDMSYLEKEETYDPYV